MKWLEETNKFLLESFQIIESLNQNMSQSNAAAKKKFNFAV